MELLYHVCSMQMRRKLYPCETWLHCTLVILIHSISIISILSEPRKHFPLCVNLICDKLWDFAIANEWETNFTAFWHIYYYRAPVIAFFVTAMLERDSSIFLIKQQQKHKQNMHTHWIVPFLWWFAHSDIRRIDRRPKYKTNCLYKNFLRRHQFGDIFSFSLNGKYIQYTRTDTTLSITYTPHVFCQIPMEPLTKIEQ